MSTRTYTISPSDLTFLFQECPRCFAYKYRLNVRRPRLTIPSIFNRIDSAIKDSLSKANLNETILGAPICRVVASDVSVESDPIPFEHLGVQLVLKGILDSVVEYPDASRAVIDYKTVALQNASVYYQHQLDAYTYSLLHPGPRQLRNWPISSESALVLFEPARMTASMTGQAALIGSVSWLSLPYLEDRFLDILTLVAITLAGNIPKPARNCEYCSYFQSRTELEGQSA